MHVIPHSTVVVAPEPVVAKQDSTSFFVIFGAGFVVFLAIALVGSVLGAPWRSWLPGAESVKGLTGGVKAAVYTFMAHLQ